MNDIGRSTNKSKIVTIRPKSFDGDAKIISDYLLQKVPVLINLENTNLEEAHRILDFILGTIFVIEGEVKQVNKNVFVCVPKNVTITFSREELMSMRSVS